MNENDAIDKQDIFIKKGLPINSKTTNYENNKKERTNLKNNVKHNSNLEINTIIPQKIQNNISNNYNNKELNMKIQNQKYIDEAKIKDKAVYSDINQIVKKTIPSIFNNIKTLSLNKKHDKNSDNDQKSKFTLNSFNYA